jgi:hypothetical protein
MNSDYHAPAAKIDNEEVDRITKIYRIRNQSGSQETKKSEPDWPIKAGCSVTLLPGFLVSRFL